MASKRAIRKRKASGQQESENANPQSLPSPSDSKASRYVTIQEFEKLKKKYDALKSARTTEVEKLFQQYKVSRPSSMQDMIISYMSMILSF
jgi:hypothetical protein